MQTIPNPAELTLHVRLKPEGVQAGHARRRKRQDHAKAAVLLDNATLAMSCSLRAWIGQAPIPAAHVDICAQLMHEQV